MNLKMLLIFASGLGLGGVGGFIATRLYYRKKMAGEIDARVNAVVKAFESEVVVLDDEPGHMPDAGEMPDAEMYKPGNQNVDERKDHTFKPKGSFATDYGAMYEHPMDDDELEKIEEMDNWKKADESVEKHARAPRLIKSSEFGQLPNFAQVFLTYYTGSDTFEVDGDSPQIIDAKDVDEIRGMLGDTLDKYGFKDSDETEIYVRNFARETDYDIVKVETYEDDR